MDDSKWLASLILIIDLLYMSSACNGKIPVKYYIEAYHAQLTRGLRGGRQLYQDGRGPLDHCFLFIMLQLKAKNMCAVITHLCNVNHTAVIYPEVKAVVGAMSNIQSIPLSYDEQIKKGLNLFYCTHSSSFFLHENLPPTSPTMQLDCVVNA